MALKQLANGTWQVYLYDPALGRKKYVAVSDSQEGAKALEAALRANPPDQPLRALWRRSRWALSAKGECVCRACGAPAAHLHHVVPKRLAPDAVRDYERNGIPLCQPCHRGWHDRVIDIPHDVLTDAEFEFACDLAGTAWIARNYPSGRAASERYMSLAIVPPMPPKTAVEAWVVWREHWQRKTTRCERPSR